MAELNNSYGGTLLAANGTQLTIATSFYNETKSVDIRPGISIWTWNPTAPPTGGNYTVTVKALDHFCGTLPEGSAGFTVDPFTYPMDHQPRLIIDYNVKNDDLPGRSECYGALWSKTWHAGEDWFAPANTPVKAVAAGVVKYSSKRGSGGTRTYPGGVVIIKHRLSDGTPIYSMYAHLDPSKIRVPKGAEVMQGQKIADGLCNTGKCAGNVHLHWEMRFFLNGSGIKKAPTNYKNSCSGVPGPGYTHPGRPNNFLANDGMGPRYRWTDPTNFVDTH